jgi:hypothetical protein
MDSTDGFVSDTPSEMGMPFDISKLLRTQPRLLLCGGTTRVNSVLRICLKSKNTGTISLSHPFYVFACLQDAPRASLKAYFAVPAV